VRSPSPLGKRDGGTVRRQALSLGVCQDCANRSTVAARADVFLQGGPADGLARPRARQIRLLGCLGWEQRRFFDVTLADRDVGVVGRPNASIRLERRRLLALS
jgi:hypothetical protein